MSPAWRRRLVLVATVALSVMAAAGLFVAWVVAELLGLA